jgi:hypothetical protein
MAVAPCTWLVSKVSIELGLWGAVSACALVWIRQTYVEDGQLGPVVVEGLVVVLDELGCVRLACCRRARGRNRTGNDVEI